MKRVTAALLLASPASAQISFEAPFDGSQFSLRGCFEGFMIEFDPKKGETIELIDPIVFIDDASGPSIVFEGADIDLNEFSFGPSGDGDASPADFTAWLACFNDPNSAPFCDNADVNQSGTIDPADFTAWLAAFQAGCP